jgi:hypothetical protein
MNNFSDYLLDNYGECDRNEGCYWGKDKFGNFNGCLRTGWKGRACKHWRPLGATTLEQLKEKQCSGRTQS